MTGLNQASLTIKDQRAFGSGKMLRVDALRRLSERFDRALIVSRLT
jgi:hypothetical protein